MAGHFDDRETRDPAARERALFERLPSFLSDAVKGAPRLGRWLAGIDLTSVHDRKALAALPVLRKSDLLEFQQRDPPFGGFVDPRHLPGTRVFMSPGPLWEPQGPGPDPWQAARALHAAGVRRGDVVHNAFAYHLTPGGFFIDEGARALGCAVLPAGTGNTDMQVDAASQLRPDAYCGTPDFLKVMLDRAAETGKDLSSFKRALVSGGALFPSLRQEYAGRGIAVFQCYATAEFGVIAYETSADGGAALPGMVVSEDLIVEIVRPGTGDPVPDGEVGEVVVTGFNPAYPLVRLGTGDLSKILPGPSACGRTNMRLAGWMGRADQRTKVRGMFIDPKQVAAVLARHPGIVRGRLVVTRDGERDAMTLLYETPPDATVQADAVAATLRDVTGIGGSAAPAGPDGLPNDGKVIADERDYSS